METSTIPSIHRDPWNKAKLGGQKAPLKLKEIWAIRVRLQLADRRQELALFNLAIDSKLRGWDLVKLRGPAIVGLLPFPSHRPAADRPKLGAAPGEEQRRLEQKLYISRRESMLQNQKN